MMFKKVLLSLYVAFFLASGVTYAADKINVNTATKSELQSLNGIGNATADAIIAYREQNGPITDIEDLINVKGIGQKKVEKLTGSVTVSED